MENEEIDLSEFVNVLFKRLGLIMAMMLLGVLVAFLFNMFSRPVYEASTLLMINREDAGKLDANRFSSFTNEEDYYRTQYQLLESRSLLEQVYKELELKQYEQFAGGVGTLRRAIKIIPIMRSRLVNVRARAYDPQLAADISNTLSKDFVEDNLNNRVLMGKDIIRALESKEKSAEQQELLNSMPQVVNSDFIKSLKKEASDLQRQKAQLTAKYTSRHPEVVSIEQQLDSVRNQINVETRRLVESIKIELSGQFSGNNVRIIDPAVTPRGPVLPRKMINLVIGLAGGLLLGVLISFGLEFFDQSVKNSEDLDSKLGLAFLGVVPFDKMKKQESEYGTLLKTGNFLKAEGVRNIRAMLDFALADAPNAPFLITSSLQGEGKSNFSSNLAVALAQTGKRVLLIDGDLRRSRLHRVFKLSMEKGMSNFWDPNPKKSDYAFNVQPVADVPNLFVLTSGVRPPNPTELLGTPKMNDFLAWAQKHYDQIVVDCPALLPVADTLLWGKLIPRAIFVIRYGKTNAKLAKTAVDKLKKAGVKILGGVIGCYQPEGLSYGKYGYYKSYHYYSSDDK